MNRFRCQYQKGKVCISQTLESEQPIVYEDIVWKLAVLAVDIQKELNDEVGGEVALEVLKIHEHINKDMYGNNFKGNGESKSYYLNLTDKNKIKRTERIDVQYWGDFMDGQPSHPLKHYIELYRESKGWYKNASQE